MKTFRIIFSIFIFMILVLTIQSCTVFVRHDGRHDNGRHRGWYNHNQRQNRETIIIVPEQSKKNKNHKN